MAAPVKPIPDGYHSLTPYLICDGAAKAIEFYQQAFGAVELFRMPGPDGKLGHAEVRIGDSPLMLADEHPQMGARSPKSLGGSPISICSTSKIATRRSPGPWPPAPKSAGRWPTSFTATGWAASKTPLATPGTSPRTRRTSRQKRCSAVPRRPSA